MAFKKLKLWFDEDLASLLSTKIKVHHPSFPESRYTAFVKNSVADLELKARVELMADGLHEYMTGSYESDISIMMKILGPENEEETGMFTTYYWLMPVAKYVEKYGQDHFATSMKIIEEITKRNTGEYTIRPYLVKYPKKALAQMKKWSKSPNKHVRRLSSEGVRPRLPWASKLEQYIDDPIAILPILMTLKNDPSKYVQKSVANCINDMLKDNPNNAKEIIEKWAVKPSPECKWIIKHAIRNLRKIKDPWALNIVLKIS